MDKFDALYVINKSAKKYRIRSGMRELQRSDALYNLKYRVVIDSLEEFDYIEIHRIQEADYYYLVVDEHGYHIPKSEVNIDSSKISGVKNIDNLEQGVVNESQYTEREALNYLSEECGYNPNNFLPEDSHPNSMWAVIY